MLMNVYAEADAIIKTLKTVKLFNNIRLPFYNEGIEKAEKNNSYENCKQWFMQSSEYRAVNSILALRKVFPEAKSFLDVGSGTGFVVSIAEEMGFEAAGIEGAKELIDFVPKLSHLKIYHEDIFKFKHYGDFDLIYLWNSCPFRLVELGQTIVDQITNQCAIDGLVESVLGTPKGALKSGLNLDESWTVQGRIITKGL